MKLKRAWVGKKEVLVIDENKDKSQDADLKDTKVIINGATETPNAVENATVPKTDNSRGSKDGKPKSIG